MVTHLASSSLVQFGVVDALLVGVSESGATAADVLRSGDLGLGCGEGLGSEVIVLDGEIIEFTADAPPTPMSEDEILPFAEVCRFEASTGPAQPVAADGAPELGAAIEERLLSRNLFHAIRMHGDFNGLRVRVPPRATLPHRPLAEVLHDQTETVLPRVRGTLVGFWGPTLYQGISVAGVHLHFLADDRLAGGHVLDFADARGELRMAALSGFDLRLPTGEDFLSAELTHDDDRRIAAVENGSRAR